MPKKRNIVNFLGIDIFLKEKVGILLISKIETITDKKGVKFFNSNPKLKLDKS